MKKVGVKYCPRCGTPNNLNDAYCIKCGYAFRHAKKSNFGVILLIIGWTAYRTFTGQPIIPEGITNLFQNSSFNATG